jgi:hypothetical protein
VTAPALPNECCLPDEPGPPKVCPRDRCVAGQDVCQVIVTAFLPGDEAPGLDIRPFFKTLRP